MEELDASLPPPILNPGKGIEYLSGQDEAYTPCFRCGACCSRYQVLMDSVEARRIADHLGMNLEEFISKYADLRWPGLERYLLRQEEEECAFLEHRDKEAFCSIHCVKPQACHDWTASLYRRECRQGLAETWQLEVNAAGQITGPDEKQRLFKEFMNSLSD